MESYIDVNAHLNGYLISPFTCQYTTSININTEVGTNLRRFSLDVRVVGAKKKVTKKYLKQKHIFNAFEKKLVTI